MDNRAEFSDPEQQVIIHAEIFSAKDLDMETLKVDHLRIPMWDGVPENPVGFRNRKDKILSADAGESVNFRQIHES